jgi:RNA polymerase primary sigma factor
VRESPQNWIEGALAYVPCVARRFMGCGVSFDELLAAGNLGLVQAALRFDPSRNVKFVTYADWWIRKSILKTIQEQSGPVRLPRYRLEQLRDLHEARSRLMRDTGREPDAEELAAATGRSPGEVDLLLGIGRRGVSLEQPATPNERRPLGRLLADDLDKGPQRTLIRQDSLRQLRRLIGRLGRRERDVLRLRFGLNGHAALTLREAGEALGISRERVRQIEFRALRRLRDRIDAGSPRVAEASPR